MSTPMRFYIDGQDDQDGMPLRVPITPQAPASAAHPSLEVRYGDLTAAKQWFKVEIHRPWNSW